MHRDGAAHPVSSLGRMAHNVFEAHGVEQAAGAALHCWLGQGRLVPSAQVQHHILRIQAHTVSSSLLHSMLQVAVGSCDADGTMQLGWLTARPEFGKA